MVFSNYNIEYFDLRLRDIYFALKDEQYQRALAFLKVATKEVQFIARHDDPTFARYMVNELTECMVALRSHMPIIAHNKIRDLHYLLINVDGYKSFNEKRLQYKLNLPADIICPTITIFKYQSI